MLDSSRGGDDRLDGGDGDDDVFGDSGVSEGTAQGGAPS